MMYPLRQSRKPEEGFWYRDVVHFGDAPLYPLDSYFTVSMMDLAQSYYYGRYFSMPTSSGRDTALVEGRPFRTSYPPRPFADIFERRAREYLENWDAKYAEWKKEVVAIIEEMSRLPVDLPEGVDLNGAAPYRVIESWLKLYLLWLRLWFKHYEFLMLGYLIYQLFYKFIKTFFPDAPDHHISEMLAQRDIDTFRPTKELERLAELARELGIAERLAAFSNAAEMERSFAESGDPKERKWLEEWNAVKYPWFYISTGTGFLHWEERWIDNLDIPFTYLKKLLKEGPSRKDEERGEVLARGYADLLPESYRGVFYKYLEAARRAYRYIEEHSFYVEHLGFTVGYRKIREFGFLLAKLGVLEREDDIWYLTWGEVLEALLDGLTGWCNLTGPAAHKVLRMRIAERKALLEKMASSQPPTHIGEQGEVSDANLALLHGVGRKTGGDVVAGIAASPGRARGRVVVVKSPRDLEKVVEGCVVVTSTISPTWIPALRLAAAVVSESGGAMSHAAIIARELGKPAVVGAAGAPLFSKMATRWRSTAI
ncbi:PEP-utilizing enzyme [Pyrobaculum aerophilum]|nr:PEP-utilizing enzyme [Pyrobaculum aerophilum]